MAILKKPKTWLSLILALVCLIFTVACGTNPKVEKPPKKEETAEAASGLPEELIEAADVISDGAGVPVSASQNTSQSGTTNSGGNSTQQSGTSGSGDKKDKKDIVLVDDVPKEHPDIFDEADTPYDAFQMLTADAIDHPQIRAKISGEYWSDMFVSADRLATLLKGIRAHEITKYKESEIPEWTMFESDAELDFECLGTHCDVSFWYEHEYVNMGIYTYEYKAAEMNKPDFYNAIRWKIKNDDLNDYFEACTKQYGGHDAPELIELSKAGFSASADSITDYWFETDSDMITLTVEGTTGSEGELVVYELGPEPETEIVEQIAVGENGYVLPFKNNPGHRYRIVCMNLNSGRITLKAA
ncbi:MAG: hypothetical protein IJL71_06070 [Oscillospiraceae bacterium]|nr:hypothetical protein [Oscillospiraceae bacterium]